MTFVAVGADDHRYDNAALDDRRKNVGHIGRLLALPHISLRYGKPVDCDVFNLHVTYSKFEGDPASGAFSGAVEAGPVNPRGDFHCAGLLPPNRQARPDRADGSSRSEEHTSELQSLMRISYAVFCLKKKKKEKHNNCK